MAHISRSRGIHRLPHLFLSSVLLCGVFTFGISFLSESAFMLFSVIALSYAFLLLFEAGKGMFATRNLLVFPWILLLAVGLHLSRAIGYLFPWPKSS